ncbi:unnamed protein product [Albugo candida]|uniref:Ubiquitin-like protein ATG12 n=1 Tax=Albugo candida TaxID=65357 RepID=A0A024GLV8_9STRA|nr:unnamed protein product [Albugo candida]|eukprot:CCI47721.1 unnamed protein product [Albugo candida]
MDADGSKCDLKAFYDFTYCDAEVAIKCEEQKDAERRENEVVGPSDIPREIINALLPPKYGVCNYPTITEIACRTWMTSERPWEKWQRLVSRELVSRQGVIRYHQLLDRLLVTQQARWRPICSIREKLFLQAFDEMIRQVACQCSEQGLLLLRVRDEMRMTMSMYQTLYHDSLHAPFTTDWEPDSPSALRSEKERLTETKDKYVRRLKFLELEMTQSAEKRAKKHQIHVRALRLRNTQLQLTLQFVAVGNAPLLQKTKFTINANDTLSVVYDFLRKQLQLRDSDALFLYCNRAFAPAPDQLLFDLAKCFSIDNVLILNYSLTHAWG